MLVWNHFSRQDAPNMWLQGSFTADSVFSGLGVMGVGEKGSLQIWHSSGKSSSGKSPILTMGSVFRNAIADELWSARSGISDWEMMNRRRTCSRARAASRSRGALLTCVLGWSAMLLDEYYLRSLSVGCFLFYVLLP